jgi:hypothetical protein
MAKFHINGKGEAGACKATKGGCPFGDESEHFTTPEAARKHFEDSQPPATPTKKSKVAAADVVHTIAKTRNGRVTEQKGTLEELTKYYGYTLESGNSYNSKIPLKPKTIKSLLSALDKSTDVLQSGSYNPNSYKLVASEDPAPKPASDERTLAEKFNELQEARDAEAAIVAEQIAYDEANGAKEGRAWHNARVAGSTSTQKVKGANPKNGPTYYNPTKEQLEKRFDAKDRVERLVSAERKAKYEAEAAANGPAKPIEFTTSPGYPKLAAAIGSSWSAEDTIASRIGTIGYESAPKSPPKSRSADLAYTLNHLVPDDTRNYIVNKVQLKDISKFIGETKPFGAGALKGLTQVHAAMVKTHGSGSGPGFAEHRLPEDKRNEYVKANTAAGRNAGIGTLRKWGQPANSIQNVSSETAEMLAHHVIDRYGAENAERFWSQASARTTANRATLSQVFSTFRAFDKELKANRSVPKGGSSSGGILSVDESLTLKKLNSGDRILSLEESLQRQKLENKLSGKAN